MRTKIKELKSPPKGFKEIIGKDVTIKGWVRTVRSQKTFTFIEVNDGSTLSNFQVIADPEIPNYQKLTEAITTGTSVSIEGTIVESPGKGQTVEMQAKAIQVIGTCDPDNYPLQKKRHSFEFLRTIAHLRPRTNTLGAVARVRSSLAYATHKFFQERGFIYVQTPVITASDCEGAGELFRVSTLDPEKAPKNERGGIDYSKDFFEKPACFRSVERRNFRSFPFGYLHFRTDIPCREVEHLTPSGRVLDGRA